MLCTKCEQRPSLFRKPWCDECLHQHLLPAVHNRRYTWNSTFREHRNNDSTPGTIGQSEDAPASWPSPLEAGNWNAGMPLPYDIHEV